MNRHLKLTGVRSIENNKIIVLVSDLTRSHFHFNDIFLMRGICFICIRQTGDNRVIKRYGGYKLLNCPIEEKKIEVMLNLFKQGNNNIFIINRMESYDVQLCELIKSLKEQNNYTSKQFLLIKFYMYLVPQYKFLF